MLNVSKNKNFLLSTIIAPPWSLQIWIAFSDLGKVTQKTCREYAFFHIYDTDRAMVFPKCRFLFFILSKLRLSSISWTVTDKSNIDLMVPYKSKRIKSVISKWFGLFSFVFTHYHLYEIMFLFTLYQFFLSIMFFQCSITINMKIIFLFSIKNCNYVIIFRNPIKLLHLLAHVWNSFWAW